MEMSKVTFSKLVNVYRNLVFSQDASSGIIDLSDEELRETLLELLDENNLDDSGLSLVSENPENIKVGQKIELSVGEPRIGLGLLVRNLDELLDAPKSSFEERNNYFIIENKFFKEDTDVPDGVQRYRKLLCFIQLLRESAAYLEAEREELIFIHDGKFSIPIRYSNNDLLSIDFSFIEKVEESFIDDTHKGQKYAILADTIIGLIKGTPPTERFHILITHLPELLSKFIDGYNLFVSNFSYDKVRNELEAFRVEYTAKIHKVFSDIQNQMLSIPVATIVVATQMKSAPTLGDQFIINTAVLVGCWIFVLLVCLLIWNQKHTLDVLEQEIGRQKQLIAEKPIAEKLFIDIFKRLNIRLYMQITILWIIGGVLCVGLILAHIVYLMLTPVAWYYAVHYFEIIFNFIDHLLRP